MAAAEEAAELMAHGAEEYGDAGEVHPPLIPLRAALLVLERRLGAAEAGFAAADPAAVLLDPLLRLDPHLADAGDLGRRRLRVVFGGGGAPPPPPGEEGGGAAAAEAEERSDELHWAVVAVQ